LIEQDDDFNSSLSSGIIEKFKIEASQKQNDSTPDKITFGNITDIRDNEIQQQLNESAILAKVKCRNEGKKVHSYNFIFSFERNDCIYTGKSLGVGAAALAYNSILINELYNTFYKFKDDVVFTSEIDKDGNLLKLDEKSLRIKLRTIFFSPYKKFVIPEDNIIEAKKELAILNEKYPNRKLELIPIKNYEGVFKNLDNVEVCRLNIKQKIKANYRKYHNTVNWALSILSLLIILFFITIYLIPRLDMNPVNAGIENNRYVAYNKYGINIWESLYLNKEEMDDNMLPKIIITDTDNDNKNEIIYLMKDFGQPKFSKTIFCRNSDNILKWKSAIVPIDSIYGKEFCYDNTNLRTIHLIENETIQSKELIVTYTICDLFPFFISKLDCNGKEISNFYNPGHLVFSKLLDIDSDGKDEFIIGGFNNDYNKSACLIIFDPDFIEGKAPSFRYPKGLGKGLMKYYVLFPKIFTNKFSTKQDSRLDVVFKFIDNISVYISESADFFEKETMGKRYRLMFNLDNKFNTSLNFF
jgi:hypothetical protein